MPIPARLNSMVMMPPQKHARLHVPCIVPIIERGLSFSTDTACVLKAMLFMLAVIPKQNRARNSSVMLEDASMRSRHKGYIIEAVSMHFLLENLATRYPERGIVSSCPSGRAKSMVPSCASERLRAVLISAIRVVQLEKTIPCMKKNDMAANLYSNSFLSVSDMVLGY